MMSGLTYKKKNQLLLIISAVFLLISYWLAFKDTFALYSEAVDFESQVKSVNDVPQKLAAMQGKLAELDILSGLKQNADTGIQQELLGIVTGYCQKSGILLREFPKTNFYDEGDYRVETNIFVVEGGFVKLLELVYLLEQKNRVGKIASVSYNSKKDIRIKMFSLTATIYLQNIKKIQDEK